MGRRLRFLRQWRFWLNYLFILVVTSWLPLLKQTATMTGSDGAVLKQTTISVRAYQSWYALFTKGPGVGQGMAVAMHLGLCFIIVALVWFIMFKPIIQDLPEPAPLSPQEDDNARTGDAPVPQASRLPAPHDDNASSSGDTTHE